MNHRRIASLLFMVLLVAVAGGAAAQDAVESTARSFVADAYGVEAADLIVDHRLAMDIPAMGTVTQYKMRNPASDAVYGSFVDATGKAWWIIHPHELAPLPGPGCYDGTSCNGLASKEWRQARSTGR